MKKIILIIALFISQIGFSQITPPVTVNDSVCSGSPGAVQAIAPIGILSIEWYATQTSTTVLSSNPVFSFVNLQKDTTIWAALTDGVNSSTRTSATVFVSQTPAKPTIIQSGSTLYTNVQGTDYRWILNGFIQISTDDTITARPCELYSVEVGNNGCWSVRSDTLRPVFTIPLPTPIHDTTCSGGNGILSVNNPIFGTDVFWYTQATGGTAINQFGSPTQVITNLTKDTTLYAEVVNGACSTSGRVVVTAVVDTFIPAPVAMHDTICKGGLGTVGMTPRKGTPWYHSAPVGGISFSPPAAFPYIHTINNVQKDTTIWVSFRDGTCESRRVPSTITVKKFPTINLTPNGIGTVLIANPPDENYIWLKDGIKIAMDTNVVSLDSVGGGFFEVYIVDDMGCKSDTATITFFPFGIHEQGKTTVKLYPNPASNTVVLELNKTGISQYTVHNTLGQIVLTGKTKTDGKAKLNISKLTKGLYVVKTNSNGAINTQKLVVE